MVFLSSAAALAALGTVGTGLKTAVPIVTDISKKGYQYAKPVLKKGAEITKNPIISLIGGIVLSLIPINPINIILLLIFSIILYYINPKILHNYVDPETGITRITFLRSILYALIPYFLITIPLYSLSFNAISRLLTKI